VPDASRISSQARYDHFDTPPCVFFARFFLFFAVGSKIPSERTDGKNYGIFNFRAREKSHGYGLCALRNAQSLRRFRVRPVMTTSIRFRKCFAILSKHNSFVNRVDTININILTAYYNKRFA